jgi:hypothetical protein
MGERSIASTFPDIERLTVLRIGVEINVGLEETAQLRGESARYSTRPPNWANDITGLIGQVPSRASADALGTVQ